MSDQGDIFDGSTTCDPARLTEQAAEYLAVKHRWPELLAKIYDIELGLSRRAGMDDEAAAADAVTRTFAVADYVGGGALYLPRGDALHRAVRDSQIFHLSERGWDAVRLAQRFRLTPKQVYEIVARETRIRRERLQGKLFDAE